MKFNWGTGITVFIIAFMGHILFLVFNTTRVQADLQAEDYYEQEIHYQNRVEAISNSANLKSQFLLSQTENYVLLKYPVELQKSQLKGQIQFFKPDNATLDKTFTIEASIQQQLINKKDLIEGMYVVKVNGTSSGLPYYFEESIYIK